MKGITTQQGRDTLNRFKMEAANEVGVNLKQGYNGDLSSREAGSVGGQMVKFMWHVRQIDFMRSSWCERGQVEKITYQYALAV